MKFSDRCSIFYQTKGYMLLKRNAFGPLAFYHTVDTSKGLQA